MESSSDVYMYDIEQNFGTLLRLSCPAWRYKYSRLVLTQILFCFPVF